MEAMEDERARFAEGVGSGSYGYGGRIGELRAEGFPSLQRTVYLDHAGATLYAKSQLESHLTDLQSHVYGNPHSKNPSSLATTRAIEHTRELVLRHFSTTSRDHTVIFTSGATAALELLATAFDWSGGNNEPQDDNNHGSVFAYLRSNHTSVVGMWPAAAERGAECYCVDSRTHGPTATAGDSSRGRQGNEGHDSRDGDADFFVVNSVGGDDEDGMRAKACGTAQNGRTHANGHGEEDGRVQQERLCLFAYPAQCNFSGTRYPLEWVRNVQNGAISKLFCGSECTHQAGRRERCGCRRRWMVALDCAAYVSTAPLDLSAVPADFVCVSFYKMFGFPTGFGALIVVRSVQTQLRLSQLVRNTSLHALRKRSFYGGGTLAASDGATGYHVAVENAAERFEDGTVNFLSILALEAGFKALQSLGGMPAISTHTFALSRYLYEQLKGLRHSNRASVCEIYVTLNLLRADGSHVGYAEVQKLAAINDIHVRVGCLCNTGACHAYLGLSRADVEANFKLGHVCGDDRDIINGRPTGAVRVSLGYMSTFEDVYRFVHFVRLHFVEKDIPTSIAPGQSLGHRETRLTLSRIAVYPIKSCGGFSVDEWEVGPHGLKYDREWMVVSEPSGAALTQKQHPRMCLIVPNINLAQNIMTLSAPGMPQLTIQLDGRPGARSPESSPNHGSAAHMPPVSTCTSRVCGDTVQAERLDSTRAWLSEYLGVACVLARQAGEGRKSKRKAHNSAGESSSSGAPSEPSSASDGQGLLSFANEAHVLLLNEASVEDLCARVAEASNEHIGGEKGLESEMSGLVGNFRANLVVSGATAYEEDGWEALQIGPSVRAESLGPCSRCQMVCVDQTTGTRTPEPLRTLAGYRRVQGKILFGLYLGLAPSDAAKADFAQVVKVGDGVTVLRAGR